MIVRLLVIAGSALAGVLGTLFIRKAVGGGDPDLPQLPVQVFRPRSRRPARTQLEMRPDGEDTEL